MQIIQLIMNNPENYLIIIIILIIKLLVFKINNTIKKTLHKINFLKHLAPMHFYKIIQVIQKHERKCIRIN